MSKPRRSSGSWRERQERLAQEAALLVGKADIREELDRLRAHIEAEATKLAYDARDRFLSDMDHMTRLAHMLDPATAKKLAALVDPKKAGHAPGKISEAVHKDTIYITVVDRDRMAVSLIYSIFNGFGSGIASEKFGILFQNRGAGFTLQPGHPNSFLMYRPALKTAGKSANLIDELLPFGRTPASWNRYARLSQEYP